MIKNSTYIEELQKKIFEGYQITKDEAIELSKQPLEELCQAADEIREKFCDNTFDMCTIINGKSGRCSEDCKFCAQSARFATNVEEYPLLGTDEILEQAKYNDEKGVLRFSIVTSGRALSDRNIDKVCESIRAIKRETSIEVCVSFGLLKEEQFRKIKEAGVSRIHCNLESSKKFFETVCSTHTYDEKIDTLQAARRAGLSICSGGIMGLGESMEDRIDMAFELRELGVTSVPVNMLNPIPGTPLGNNEMLTNEDMRKIVAVYRFILPNSSIRLAGGRGLLPDKGEKCFESGANATISGDMLTTSGITIDQDMELLNKLGYKVELWND